MTEPSLDERLLSYLQTKTTPTPTLELAHAVVGPKSSKKTVNPTLYKLEKAGKVTRLAQPDGTEPHWSIKQ
jgi:Fe2+ or Zn2+ uptake regulation protein